MYANYIFFANQLSPHVMFASESKLRKIVFVYWILNKLNVRILLLSINYIYRASGSSVNSNSICLLVEINLSCYSQNIICTWQNNSKDYRRAWRMGAQSQALGPDSAPPPFRASYH